ncbi:gamma carbonic anhydrase family protein [Nocardioides sp.]|uniref:gamma carbonic anhydrase family protein n=1 Tax=Nocardioides sp. TaxID=35761 RepID=UPI003D0B003A
MPLYSFEGQSPKVAETAWVAPSAVLIGNVVVEEHASIWFNVVLRADTTGITVGAGSNVQDGSVVHCGRSDVLIGADTTIGHGCIIHGATVGNHVLVANGAIILDDAVIGDGSLIAAGSLVSPNTVIPQDVLALGRPARVQGPLSEGNRQWVQDNPGVYRTLARRFADGCTLIE